MNADETEDETSRDGESEELRQELEKIGKELRNRENKVAALNRDISELEYRMGGTAMSRALRVGDATKIASAAGFRVRIKDELKAKQDQLRLTKDDVQKAKDRLAIIEEELEQLAKRTDGEDL